MNSANTVKQTVSNIQEGIQVKAVSFMMVMKWFFIAVVAGLLIWGLIALIRKLNRLYSESRDNVSNPENNARIRKEQLELFNPIYIQRDKLPAYQMEKTGLKTPKLTIDPINQEERALINYSVLTCNNAGYIGPLQNGVFAEQEAIDLAYKAGCRAFMLHIDFLEGSKDPILIVRNASGDKISNNVGSIGRTIQAIADGAPRGSDADPIIVILFVHRFPGNKDAHHPDSINFMSNIARGLEPLKNRLLGLTAEGDFSRQKQQDSLFIRPRDIYDGKVIVLTNVDTTGFRNRTLVQNVPINQDLDYWVHARIHTNSSKNLHLIKPSEQTKSISPIAENLSFFNNIPEDRMNAQIAQTKVQWTIAMDNFMESNPEKETLKNLLNDSGVACIPINIFDTDTKKLFETVFSNEYFGRTGYRPKPRNLRYVKLAPIKLQEAPPSLNAYGGNLPIPDVGPGPFSKSQAEFKELRSVGGQGCSLIVNNDSSLSVLDRNGRSIWSTNTGNLAQNYSKPFRAMVQQDGNLVVLDSNNSPVWSSNTRQKEPKAPYTITMQDNCTAVISDGRGQTIWSAGASN